MTTRKRKHRIVTKPAPTVSERIRRSDDELRKEFLAPDNALLANIHPGSDRTVMTLEFKNKSLEHLAMVAVDHTYLDDVPRVEVHTTGIPAYVTLLGTDGQSLVDYRIRPKDMHNLRMKRRTEDIYIEDKGTPVDTRTVSMDIEVLVDLREALNANVNLRQKRYDRD